jgi:acyl-CoA thioesterase
LEVKDGYSKSHNDPEERNANGFGIAHGGITLHWLIAHLHLHVTVMEKLLFALDVSISFPKAGKEGDVLIAEAKAVSRTKTYRSLFDRSEKIKATNWLPYSKELL